MAGIYIHIPFCKTRCIYCDFYSDTRIERKESYINALCRELESRKPYLKEESVETLYFGGGTPTLLDAEDFDKIFHTLSRIYGLNIPKEITLEANPDDLSPEYLQTLSPFPINRISIGIQTFNDPALRLLNRRHNAAQAVAAINNCRRAGFDNISIDLIYGLPGQTLALLTDDLSQALSLHVEHLSAYCLTYEKDTPIYNMLQEHRVEEADEETGLSFFNTLADTLTTAGYEHYEISNFCLPGKHSQHNTSYWQGIAYMGCGPSAHSYNGQTRQWNIASLNDYIAGNEENRRIYQIEEIDQNTRYNELILTTLRTRQGLPLQRLENIFGEEYLTYCLAAAQKHLENGNLEQTPDNRLKLTRKGIFISDGVISDLFRVNE